MRIYIFGISLVFVTYSIVRLRIQFYLSYDFPNDSPIMCTLASIYVMLLCEKY